MKIPPAGARSSPAALRNRDAIALVLAPRLPRSGLVLEIAAGSGEHAVRLAAACPDLEWQPTDPDADALASIAAWRIHADLPNLRAPLRLDAAEPDSWPLTRADAIVCINMIHISPWPATVGLFGGSSRLLPAGGLLYLYGPYKEGGAHTAPTNALFDADLRGRDPAWGVRDLDDVVALAADNGLTLKDRVAMPANNLSLVFVRA